MQVTIDSAGRIVVPKPLREELGLSPETTMEIEVVDGHLEISTTFQPAVVAEGPNGPVVAPTGTAISERDVRRLLEAARERR
jgi:AbrB family looped-hinge helix DNA binding protein